MLNCLVGHSASGKSSIERELEKLGIPRIISHTSRSPRSYEVNGREYYFISDAEFLHLVEAGHMAEYQQYNGWFYGASMKDIDYKNKDYVLVIAPEGFYQLVENLGSDHIRSFFINVPERERLVRLANRGDSVDEIIRRIIADRTDFAGFEDVADYVFDNEVLDSTVWSIYNIIKC